MDESSEPDFPFCPLCGAEMEWVDCWHCCCLEPELDLNEDCSECNGEGRYLECTRLPQAISRLARHLAHLPLPAAVRGDPPELAGAQSVCVPESEASAVTASPTARTLARLRRNGYLAAVVERRLPGGWKKDGEGGKRGWGKTVDLWNWCDILAIRADRKGVLGIQATSASNISARWKKLIACPALRVWLAAGNRAEVWGWRKSKMGKWEVVKRVVRIEDLKTEAK